MNAPDEWASFEPPPWWNPPLTDEQRQQMADDYQRDAIATAQSEAAQEAARKEYSK